MRKIAIVPFLLLSISIFAQQHMINPSIEYGPYKKNQTLNQSNLISVKESEIISITPDIELAISKKYFLRGLLKVWGQVS